MPEKNNTNILFLSTRAPFPPNTGHFQRTYNIVKQISKSANVYFLAFYDKGLSDADKRKVEEGLGEITRYLYLEELEWEGSGSITALQLLKSIFRGKPFIAQKYYSETLVREIDRILNEQRIDIVHLDMLPLAEYIQHVGSLPAVLTNHNVESLRLKRRAYTENNYLVRSLLWFQYKMLYKYERSVLRALQYCVAVSAQDADYLREFNPGCRFFIIPNGVDLSHYKNTDANTVKGNGKMLLWVGSMADPYNRAGIEYFVRDVLPGVFKEHPDASWSVVGKNPPDVLQQAARDNPSIKLIGYVDDVRAYYEKSDILVIPLLSGSGTKLKVIEGMAMAMPIVTTTVGAEGIEIENGVDVIIADEKNEFIDGINRLLGSHETRRLFSENVRKIAEREYGWDAIGTSMIDVYEDIINVHQSGTRECVE